jgi:hypothetical protein
MRQLMTKRDEDQYNENKISDKYLCNNPTPFKNGSLDRGNRAGITQDGVQHFD